MSDRSETPDEGCARRRDVRITAIHELVQTLWAIAEKPRKNDEDWKTIAQGSLSLLLEVVEDADYSTFADQQRWWDDLSDALFQDLDIDLIAYEEIMRIGAPCLELLRTPNSDEADVAHEFTELIDALNARRWGYGDGDPIFVPNDISPLI